MMEGVPVRPQPNEGFLDNFFTIFPAIELISYESEKETGIATIHFFKRAPVTGLQ